MKRLEVLNMGDKVQGVRITGDPKNGPEPMYFRVEFPGGSIDISRCTEGDKNPDYWIHVAVNRPASGSHQQGVTVLGRVKDARIDAHDKHGGEIDASVLNDPELYHLAIRVGEDDV